MITQDYAPLMKKAKKDIKIAIDSWKEVLLESLGDKILYAYTKGSAMKKWQSEIDYVPILSDLDIHIKLKEGKTLFDENFNKIEQSIEISRNYEKSFLAENHEYIHIPRSQVMVLNELEKIPRYVPPRSKDVFFIIGTPFEKKIDEITSSRIKKMDYQNLIEEKDTINKLPESLMDRTGLDFWSLLRRISWKVSPAPVRLLTQIKTEDYSPQNIWSWNRTTIEKQLNKEGFSNLALNYKSYYLTGWELFLDGFHNSELFRKIIMFGYHILYECIELAHHLNLS